MFPKAKQRSHTSHGNQFKQDTPRPIKGIQIPESAKILLVESPESWALESAISLRIGIQNPRPSDKDRDPLPGIWNSGPFNTGHRCYEPVICTRVGSYLFLLLIELSCCLYLDVMLYNWWNLLVPSNVCPRPKLLQCWT